MADEKKRPPRRSKSLTFRVDDETFDKAHNRADREGRSLSSVLRSLFWWWAEDEIPTPPPLDDDDVRAQKVSKKKRKE